MRIVHVEDFIHPDAGYQVNVLSRLQVEQGHDVVIVTGELEKIPAFLTAFFGRGDLPAKDDAFHRRTGVRIVRVPLLGFVSGRAIFHPRLFGTVDDLNPDVLFVHGEDTMTGMQFIVRSLWQRYPMILDCHMLEMASKNRFRALFRAFYRTFITPIILWKGIPLVRVVDSDFVEKCLGIPLEHTDLLPLGTDTSLFRPDLDAYRSFRERHGFAPNDLIVLYAGKLDHHKDGILLARAFRDRMHGPDGRCVRFVVVGNAVGEYGERVEEVLTESENPVLRLPTQPYPRLPALYQAADVAVFAKHCSLSFFDLQACGVPVVMERNEINTERAELGGSVLFEPGSVEGLREGIRGVLALDPAERAEIGHRARSGVLAVYDYVPIAEEFTAVLKRAIDRFHSS